MRRRMLRKRKEPEWVRNFEASSHLRQPGAEDNNAKGGVTFRITSIVYAGGFPEASTRLTVTKTFSEVRKFRAALCAIHRGLHLKGVVPELPPVLRGSKESRLDPEVVEVRRRAILQLLDFAALHPPLFNSQCFVEFFSTSLEAEGAVAAGESDSDEVRTPSPGDLVKRVAELKCAGNVMDAAAESTRLASDPTPLLQPTKSSSSNLSVTSSASHTPAQTSPDEEMKNLPDYLSRAAEDVSKAVQHELEDDLDESVACYRKAIGTLLSSVQQDRCLKRQASVKRRIAQYIEKAEGLVQERDRRNCAGILTPIQASPLRVGGGGAVPHLDFVGDPADLKKYKVVGVISDSVQLARDFRTGTKVVIKTMLKSPVASRSGKRKKRSLLPVGVRGMVRLLCYFETDDVLYLILEHLEYGQIYQVVSNIFVAGGQEEEDMETKEEVIDSATIDRSPINPSRSVIKPSPSFIEIRNRMEEEEAAKEGSVDSLEDTEVVHQVPSESGQTDTLLCFSKDGIEQISCEEEEEEENNNFDFMDDSVDEEGEEVMEEGKPEKLLDAAKTLMCNIDSKLLVDNDKASSLLDHLDSLESRLHLHLSDSVPSPFRRPSSSFRPKTPTLSPLGNDLPEKIRMLPPFQGYSFNPGSSLPPSTLKTWAVQLCKALFGLHSRGVLIGDLHPGNLLLSDAGDLVLSYQCEWSSVDKSNTDSLASDWGYAAPETRDPTRPLTPACDWWSVGVLLFELSTGEYFSDLHPSGLRVHTPVEFPNDASVDRRLSSFVSQLLHPLPEFRLGAGTEGERDIKRHAYFKDVDWQK